MLKISKLAFSGSLVFTLVSLTMFLAITGCEQILDEALKKEITVQEDLFDSENHEQDSGEVLSVASGFSFNASGKSLPKTSAQVFAVTPANAALFAWVCAESGGELRGALQNRSAESVTFAVHFGHTNDFAAASLIGTVEAAGNEAKDFSFSGSSFEAFFEESFSARFDEFYVFLSAESNGSVDLLVESMEFALQPAHHISRSVGPLTALASYMNSIDDITDISLGGSIVNRGSSPMLLLLAIRPAAGGGDWTGMEIETEIAPGATLNLADWSSLMTEAQIDDLDAAVRYLSSGTVLAELFMTTESGLRVDIVSIVLSGSVSVAL